MKHKWYDEKYGFFGTFYHLGDHSKEGFDVGQTMSREERTKREIKYIKQYLSPKPSDIILDCPCGSGRHSFGLAKEGFTVLGVDLNESMLKFSREIETDDITNPPEFLVMDMRNLELEDESVDHVINMFISFGFFESDEENEQVVKEFYRVLKPGGKLLIHLDLNYDNVINGKFNGSEHISRSCNYSGEQKTLEIKEKYNPINKRLEGTWTLINGEPISKSYSIRIYDNDKEFIPLFLRNGFSSVKILDPINDKLNEYSSESILIATK